jgi:diguanylate cyclase (GGDEF)-like protein
MTGLYDIEINEDMQLQENRDIAGRSFTGSYIYLIVWLAIMLPNRLYVAAPAECLWLTLTFSVLAFVRIVLIKKFDTIYSNNPLVWKVVFFPVVVLTSLAWGVFCAMSLVLPAFQPISLVTIICTAGMTGGGGASLSPNRALTLALITSFLLPGIVAMLFFSSTADLSLGIVFFFYWLGMYSVTKTQHLEYWMALKGTFVVRQYAAELQKLSVLDGLTGLKNRAYFDDTLRKELKNARRLQSCLILLLIDIDHFKNVNDRYGHLVGDECLRLLSSCLSRVIRRETDTVARFGGEEFAVILPGLSVEQGVVLAEKIRVGVGALEYVSPEERVRFTVSIGISSATLTPDETEATFVDGADKALYQAKANGRNQLSVWNPSK